MDFHSALGFVHDIHTNQLYAVALWGSVAKDYQPYLSRGAVIIVKGTFNETPDEVPVGTIHVSDPDFISILRTWGPEEERSEIIFNDLEYERRQESLNKSTPSRINQLEDTQEIEPTNGEWSVAPSRLSF
jgi:hypothetical protein